MLVAGLAIQGKLFTTTSKEGWSSLPHSGTAFNGKIPSWVWSFRNSKQLLTGEWILPKSHHGGVLFATETRNLFLPTTTARSWLKANRAEQSWVRPDLGGFLQLKSEVIVLSFEHCSLSHQWWTLAWDEAGPGPSKERKKSLTYIELSTDWFGTTWRIISYEMPPFCRFQETGFHKGFYQKDFLIPPFGLWDS
jgi:hypothetical protein